MEYSRFTVFLLSAHLPIPSTAVENSLLFAMEEGHHPLLFAMDEGSASQPPALPADLLCQIFQHATVRQWATLARISVESLNAVRLLRASCRMVESHNLSDLAPSLHSMRLALAPLRMLTTLRLPAAIADHTSHITDEHLFVLSEQLPCLEVLDLRNQPQVTNRGVRQLASSSSSLAATLVEVDLTACPLVGYSIVQQLHARCPRLRLVRRLPAWLVGWTTTCNGEKHTYYADGSFEFTRDTEARGWVAQCRVDEQTGDVETRLIYIDDPEGLWGPQAHNGRVGVLIRRVHPHADKNFDEHALPSRPLEPTDSEEALVVQSLRVPEPPPAFPTLASSSLPGRGSTRFFRKVDGGVMCSRLCINHGAQEERPPIELQRQLSHFCVEFASQRRDFERRALKSILVRQTADERIAAVMSRLTHALSPPSI